MGNKSPIGHGFYGFKRIGKLRSEERKSLKGKPQRTQRMRRARRGFRKVRSMGHGVGRLVSRQ